MQHIESPSVSSSPLPAAPRARRGFGSVRENIWSALFALRQNMTRSLLTMTGIVIGVLSIVTLIAILQGVKNQIGEQVEGLGANLVIIVPGKLDEEGRPNPFALAAISPLTEEDIAALKRVPGVEKVSPVSIVSGTVEGPSGKTSSAFVLGTNKAGVVMNPTPLAEGRYFEDSEKHVCILAAKPRKQLFGDGPALGKKIRVSDIDWTVVGVMGRSKGEGTIGEQLLGLSTLIYLPVAPVQNEISGNQINRIALQTDYQHPADKLVAQINKALLAAHKGHDDFGVITQQKGLDLVVKLVSWAQALLVLIAAISLFVAGVGIMNIMLVTVTERTREIGIRKTVGARQSDIFLQFLTEAIILAIIGGLIGLGLSKIICVLVAHNSPITPLISWQLIVMAFAVCVTVGVVFGVTPAVRASRLNPIDALRHE